MTNPAGKARLGVSSAGEMPELDDNAWKNLREF
jgi:hypothetical protein